ncbi:hypothetical protein LGL55_10435 [Clostridium tagluense]|uniref:hypothetical protein n=1 Tax=Clostridium tagluense TaxID=360422 RepID=UPI001CF5507B|nr:hypothetical protein [Clostridium tagluense]MCB2299614.1 hypothetical protein [Clostridium tagluense]MCB2311644.1 hypothetical protein [Clostridium tagluense]MCB2316368.1 hypothetical protein [Clostridium tagluense]MCB2321248.1 hypothetical protein [Clostridium tagluense]MCB2326237.1 hypothetical protein [Clostridium tagluense]
MPYVIYDHELVKKYWENNYPTSIKEQKEQIKKTSKLLIELTSTKSVSEAIGYILDTYIAHYYNKYSKNNFYYTLTNIHDFIFDKTRCFTNKYILEILYRQNYSRIAVHCKNISNFYNEDNDEFFQTKVRINNKLLTENDLDYIHKVLLSNPINGRDIFHEIDDKLLESPFKKKLHAEAFHSLLCEYCNLFEVNMSISKMSQEKKVQELEKFYDNNLEKEIYDVLKDNPTSNKARTYMNINTHLWKFIREKYMIKFPEKVYDIEGNRLDSKDELFIDNYFHEKNIKHRRLSRKGLDSKMFYDEVSKSYFLPDWIVNDDIIVEHFGYVGRNSAKYAKDTIKKQQYYISLPNYYLISSFKRNLTTENLDHLFKPYLSLNDKQN